MKKGLLIWNVLLTVAAGFLLIKQFSGGRNHPPATGPSRTDTAAAGNNFRIAYFEMDTVAANFFLVRDVEADLKKKEDEINGEMDMLSKEFQQKYVYYQKQDQAGSLSQQDRENARNELEQMNDRIRQRKQQLDQDYNDVSIKKQTEIKNKIETYLREFNKTRNYAYIIAYEKGLFYYGDSIYNITSDLVRGLNEYYKPGKKN